MVIHRTPPDDTRTLTRLILIIAGLGLASVLIVFAMGCAPSRHSMAKRQFESMPGNWQTVESEACRPACLTITVIPEDAP